jgi:hypothetical protein
LRKPTTLPTKLAEESELVLYRKMVILSQGNKTPVIKDDLLPAAK